MNKTDLQKVYMEHAKDNASDAAIYAQLGALGVSVKHLQLYEESMKLIKNNSKDESK